MYKSKRLIIELEKMISFGNQWDRYLIRSKQEDQGTERIMGTGT